MEPNFPDIIIKKKIYQTKNSTIWLIQGNDDKKEYSILKSILKEGLCASQVDMIKRERKFYEENFLGSFPRFIKAYQDGTNVYMRISFIEGLNMCHLLKENLMHFNKKNDNRDLFLYLIAQIIDLISIIHQKSYVYRDLKMNNIIIDKSLKCYLVDFGFVKNLDTIGKTSTICGTLHMQAPEIFLTKLKKESSYSYSVDIYAVGVLIYEMFTGRPPFPYKVTSNEMDYIDNVLKGLTNDHFPNDFSEEENIDFNTNIIDLIKGCMKTNPNERYSMNQIKEHKLFSKGFEYYLSSGEQINTEAGQAKSIIDSIAFDGEFITDYNSMPDNPSDDPFAMF